MLSLRCSCPFIIVMCNELVTDAHECQLLCLNTSLSCIIVQSQSDNKTHDDVTKNAAIPVQSNVLQSGCRNSVRRYTLYIHA